jgi:phospholipid transport system substrate-binding protein
MTARHPSSKVKTVYTLGVLALLAGTLPAHEAAAADDASGFVAELESQAIHILKDAKLSAADRQQSFGALMSADFDMPKIARIVLGRYWSATSDIERLQFSNAFADYTVQMYSARFADYSAASFRVIKQRTENETTTLVSTQITRVATGEPIDLDWSVEKIPGSYKIIDISAAGVSLARAQREEFSSAVQRSGGSVSDLIQQLRSKVTELAASAR